MWQFVTYSLVFGQQETSLSCGVVQNLKHNIFCMLVCMARPCMHMHVSLEYVQQLVFGGPHMNVMSSGEHNVMWSRLVLSGWLGPGSCW